LETDESRFVRAFHPVVVVRPEDCTGCLLCELLCPDLAITVERKAQRQEA
jgi:2-oxoglutarate ferredoxin oxidoreductase subunit delta